MDLDFSEEQTMLQDNVFRLCEDYHDSAAIRALESDAAGYNHVFWQAMGAMGLCGVLVPEQYGGIGWGNMECAIVHEVLGRTLAPSPHFEACVLSARLLTLAGSEEQRTAWLPLIASGKGIVVPAWQELGVSSRIDGVTARVRQVGDSLQLTTEKVLVPFANSADAFIVIARDEQGLLGLIVPSELATLRAQPNHALQSLFAVSFDQVSLPWNACLNRVDLESWWDRTMLEGQIAVAAQAVGGASRILDMTLQYAKVREQFGQTIGTFQAISHYLADRATELEGARYLVYQAALACDRGGEFDKLALMAKFQATAVFRRATVTGVQIHGGMGFSLEADPQLYYRRAKHLQLMYWDPRYLEQRIADEVFG